MPIPRVEITNWELWGMLVKSWATGANCFLVKPYSDMPAPKLPKNLAAFKTQCDQFNVGVSIPDRVTGLQFIQSNQETLMIRLPDAEMVRDSEATIQADPGSYPLPNYYHPGFTTPHLDAKNQPFYGAPLKVNKDNVMIFHACRIGDYTIAQCG